MPHIFDHLHFLLLLSLVDLCSAAAGPSDAYIWIVIGLFGGLVVVLAILFLLCYYNDTCRKFVGLKSRNKISSDEESKKSIQEILTELAESHHAGCICQSCYTEEPVDGDKKYRSCPRCSSINFEFNHKPWNCIKCNVAYLHQKKSLQCSCQACQTYRQHKDDNKCVCSSCIKASKHAKWSACECATCQRNSRHGKREPYCNCLECQTTRVHRSRQHLHHISQCFHCQVSWVHDMIERCDCKDCTTAKHHTKQHLCDCKTCYESQVHMLGAYCLCNDCEVFNSVPECKPVKHRTKLLKDDSADSGVDYDPNSPRSSLQLMPLNEKTCVRCGNFRRRSSSQSSQESYTDLRRRKSTSSESINQLNSVGIQATEHACARKPWRAHTNPMLSQTIHVFDREKYWSQQRALQRDIISRRERYRTQNRQKTFN